MSEDAHLIDQLAGGRRHVDYEGGCHAAFLVLAKNVVVALHMMTGGQIDEAVYVSIKIDFVSVIHAPRFGDRLRLQRHEDPLCGRHEAGIDRSEVSALIRIARRLLLFEKGAAVFDVAVARFVPFRIQMRDGEPR